jgi:hypothetical protein
LFFLFHGIHFQFPKLLRCFLPEASRSEWPAGSPLSTFRCRRLSLLESGQQPHGVPRGREVKDRITTGCLSSTGRSAFFPCASPKTSFVAPVSPNLVRRPIRVAHLAVRQGLMAPPVTLLASQVERCVISATTSRKAWDSMMTIAHGSTCYEFTSEARLHERQEEEKMRNPRLRRDN